MPYHHSVSRHRIVLSYCLFLLLASFSRISPGYSSGSSPYEGIFWGEPQALTVLSSKSENPFSPPGSTYILTAEDLERYGFLTLGEALSFVPGFYMGRVWWGSRPYLRGVPEGVLFLYDGVPLTSDSTKTLNLLDEELNLEALERIEIVLGPGSVLWGPDAFAGIVNLIPKHPSGKRLRLKTFLGSPFSERKIVAGLSYPGEYWRGTMTFSLWGKKFTGEHTDELEELVFNLEGWPGIRIVGRFSSGRKSFKGYDSFLNLDWPGRRKYPVNFLKGEFRHPFGPWALDLKAYWESTHPEREEMDFHLSQKSRTLGLEGILSREWAGGKGMFTLGVGYRRNRTRDAVIRVRGLLSQYLKEMPYFRPLVDRKSFDTELLSFFFQARHRFRSLEWYGGLRFDDHTEYRPGWSFSTGLYFRPSSRWGIKLNYGSAYRTPYAAEFLDRNPSPERAYTLSLELLTRPHPRFSWRITPFYTLVKRMVLEHPLGGFSHPIRRHFLGLETQLSLQYSPSLHLTANLSVVNSWGSNERYRVLEYMIYDPATNNWTPFYHTYRRPYASGPHLTGNLLLDIKASRNLNIITRINFLSNRTFHDLRKNSKTSINSSITVDASVRWRLGDRTSLFLLVKDLFDRAPRHASYLSTVADPGFRIYLGINHEWNL
ncbi:TonB-dependent siderophore receptor [Thermosulfurimonas sp. F29]|uniref:TonB-dependent receptor plug domain-containing protein n=1 Tax=Thermosulfurimonas sp. F29 TaxID=2867247 RepID=UPI001C83C47E|nr:TonB-dependent receptor [Thermosulfurimonas sp. F29]MBX6424261.1 TonB-dependent receptor [Thermosulfurimonas sp. F29]